MRPGNQPAFPRPWSLNTYGDRPVEVDEQRGMSLRDYLAGQALVGLYNARASDDESPMPLLFYSRQKGCLVWNHETIPASLAVLAVEQADALLAALYPPVSED